MTCIIFTYPNGVHQSSSPIYNNDGDDPNGVNPMKSALAHQAIGYYSNTEI